ncbi:MAG: hypothetical protein OXG02_08190 [Chloroflexi bacterium]|nr:hypothetical protein [Chloroflexota bacterium]
MSTPKTSLHWGFLAAAALALAAAYFFLDRGREDSSKLPTTTDSLPTLAIPTLLPSPNPIDLEIFPEYVLERYAYDETAYPQYAEALPEASCATWENGGLTWRYLEDHPEGKLGWSVSVWLPIFRFCGFPQPYPRKPLSTRNSAAPEKWVIWKATQLAKMPPGPTITPSP